MTELQPPQILFQMLTGAWVTKSLGVATELAIPDCLEHGPKSVTALAAETSTHEDSLYRVLRMLAAVGVFSELPQKTFALTPISQMLLSSNPQGMRNFVRMATFGEHWDAWGSLLDVVRGGGIATDIAEGCDIWEHYRKNPDRAAIFDASMTDFTLQTNAAVVAAFDFSQHKRVCDVGGGHGWLIRAILEANPALEGIVFDQDYVADGARKMLAEAGLAARTTCVGGSFFEAVAEGADLYMAKNIIHDWDDEKSITILRQIRKVIPASGRLLLVEVMVGPANVPEPGKFMDINMLAMTGGRERTAEDFAALFAASGFSLGRVIPTHSLMNLIEALPV
ncbi:MAG: methyltransferase [Acidobacteria bacterium]|nr:methyltransferase [Acidobacteriota bacterium]